MKKGGDKSIIHEGLLSSLDIQGWNLKSFAEEIYENIGQLLSLAKIQIATINPEKKEEARRIVESSDQLLNRIIKDLRSLARQLTPTEIMHKGFAASLHHELDRLNKIGLCRTDFLFTGNSFRLKEVRELILFSIIQHYILKALYIENARQINVTVLYKNDMIIISIYFTVNTEFDAGFKKKKTVGVFRRARLIGALIRVTRKADLKNISIRVKK